LIQTKCIILFEYLLEKKTLYLLMFSIGRENKWAFSGILEFALLINEYYQLGVLKNI